MLMKKIEKQNFIIMVVSGSHAYGMATETSDIDAKGAFIAPLSSYFSGNGQEQVDDRVYLYKQFRDDLPDNYLIKAESNGFEGVAYELSKFLKLAAGANPNILDVLFCRDSEVFHITNIGKALRDNREKFLTKKSLNTFLGYAAAQSKRIESHRKWLLDPPKRKPERIDFGLPERSEIPQDQIMAAMAEIRKEIDSWSIDFGDIDEATKIYVEDQIVNRISRMQIGSSDSDKFKIAGNLLGYETNFMKLIVSQREYDCAVANWKSFQKWKEERNDKRRKIEAQIGYDAKHAAHLYRLIVACKSIFETGELHVYNPDPFIMKIRNCEIPYDKFLETVNKEKEDISLIASKSSLPSSVSSVWLDEFCTNLIKEFHGIK